MVNKSINWVGHRGWPARYPENTLAGARAAFACGAAGVEVDIQFTADGEPVLLHDIEVTRTGDSAHNISQLTLAEAADVSVHEPARFDQQFYPSPIAHLNELLALHQEYPKQQLFIEVKNEIFEHYPRLDALQILAKFLSGCEQSFYLISFDLYVLRLAQEHFGWRVGWVLTHFDELSHGRVKHNPVDVVICNFKKIPATTKSLWQGGWEWFMYDITTAEQTAFCQQYGVTWLESWDVGNMPLTNGTKV